MAGEDQLTVVDSQPLPDLQVVDSQPLPGTQPDTGIWAGVKRNTVGLVTGLYHAFSDPATDQEKAELKQKVDAENANGGKVPEDLATNPSRVTLAYHRLVDAPASDLAQKGQNEQKAAKDLLAQGENWKGGNLYTSGLVDRGLAAVPMLGPWINGVAQRYESGDRSGAATDLAAALAFKHAEPLAKTGAAAAGAAVDALPSAGDVGLAARTPKGALKPSVKAAATAAGAFAGHMTGVPFAGELGGAVLGPRVADALIPKLPTDLPSTGTGAPLPSADEFYEAKAKELMDRQKQQDVIDRKTARDQKAQDLAQSRLPNVTKLPLRETVPTRPLTPESIPGPDTSGKGNLLTPIAKTGDVRAGQELQRRGRNVLYVPEDEYAAPRERITFPQAPDLPGGPRGFGQTAEAAPSTTASTTGEYPMASDSVSGLKVRDHIPNTDSIGATFNNPKVMPGIREVPFSDFDAPADKSPRSRDLAGQIKQSGEINPLIVAIDKDGPYILEGAHRYDALKMNGHETFPAKVVIDGDNPPVDTSRPDYAYRVRNQGEEGIPIGSRNNGAHATTDLEDAQRLMPGRQMAENGEPQEVVKYDLSKLKEGKDYVRLPREGAPDWIRMLRPLGEGEVQPVTH